MSATARALAASANRVRSQTLTGIYRRMDGPRAVVSLLGADVAIPSAATIQPVPNSAVHVELREAGYVMLGPVKPPPTRGRVTATGSSNVTVLGSDGVSYQLPRMDAYAPAIDDDVAIEWSEAGGLVKGKVSSTPVAAPVLTPAVQTGKFHPSPFLATAAGYHVLSSGAFNGGYFPLYGNSPTVGLQGSAAWYGTAVADTIPDDAVIDSARIFLSTRSQAFGGPKLQVIAGAGPQNRVQVGGDFPISGRAGWVPIPTEVIDLLKVAPRGISLLGATSPSGSDVYNKLTADPLSFALDIAWRS
ncbi:hypothetical protein L332_03650 [Agrococcus pavilionensis RW1]|uniref:Uncharacterized protein n=1 Tax=Agrococcus pavilionensis RW1 TaxID=1330458 RepID=U1MNS4_9MICO|nr:hypothetical protein [Agrococcus pavilionensis]ERG63546.1 hypothetical protein L332_03650 [Agrococcus pavilionensis RW1]